jgi:hypothetical protein
MKYRLFVVCGLVSILFLAACQLASNTSSVYSLGGILEENQIGTPALFLHDHSISILSPEKQEFFPVFRYPEEATIRVRGEAILRSNNIYFGVSAESEKKQEFTVWKYDIDAKELQKILSLPLSSYQLLKVSPEEKWFQIGNFDTKENIWIQLEESKKVQASSVKSLEKIHKTFFTSIPSHVIVMHYGEKQFNKENNTRSYLFSVLNLDNPSDTILIGEGIRSRINDDGTLFAYQSADSNQLHVYNLQTQKTTSFSFTDQKYLKWGFWGMDELYVCLYTEEYSWEKDQLEVASLSMDGTIQWFSLPATMTEGRTTSFSRVFQNQLFFYSLGTLSLDLVRVDKKQQWTSWEVMDPLHYTEKQNTYRSGVFQIDPMNPYTGERMERSGFFDSFRPLRSDEETFDGPQTLIVYNAIKDKVQTFYIDEQFSEAREYGKLIKCKVSEFLLGGDGLIAMMQTGIDGRDEFIKKPVTSSFYYYNVDTGDFQFLSSLEHVPSIAYFDSRPHSLSHQENYLVLSQDLQTVEDEISFQLMVCSTEESSLNPTTILPMVDENDSSYNEFLCWID